MIPDSICVFCCFHQHAPVIVGAMVGADFFGVQVSDLIPGHVFCQGENAEALRDCLEDAFFKAVFCVAAELSRVGVMGKRHLELVYAFVFSCKFVDWRRAIFFRAMTES